MAQRDNQLSELRGCAVVSIELIGLIRINFEGRVPPQLSIESAFEVSTPDGTTVHCRFNPAAGEWPVGLDAVGALYGKVLADARMLKDGSLVFEFDDGTVLRLPVDPNYESGHIVAPGLYLVVPPGGR